MRRAPRGAPAAVVAVLLGLGAPVPAVAAAPAQAPVDSAASRAHAQQPTDAVAGVVLTSVSPIAPRGAGPVVLRGRVSNTGDQPLSDLSIYLRFSRDPLQQRSEVRRVVQDPSYREGLRFPVTAGSAITLQPGASAPYRVSFTGSDVGVRDPGVYVAGVEVLATRPGVGLDTVARARTVVPWNIPGTARLPVALVWPLATRPSLLPNGSLSSPALERDIAPGGVLRGILDTGARAAAPLTWLVDPELVDATARLAGGYRVVDATGSDVAGTESASAGSFFASLRTVTRTGPAETLLLPFADVDSAALARQGSRGAQLVADAVSRAGGVGRDRLDSRLRVAAASDASPDGETRRVLAAAGTDLVLVGPAPPVVVGTPLTTGSRPGEVRTDDALASALTAARSAGLSTGQLRQELLADSALAVLGSGPNDPAPLVLAPPRRWRPAASTAAAVLASWQDAPWVRPVPLSTAVSLGGTGDAAVPPPAQGGPSTTARQTRRMLDLDEQVQALGAVVDRPPPLLRDAQDAVLRTGSTGWRFAPNAAAAYADRSAATVRFRSSLVRVIATDRITLSSRSGRFPLEVANDLPVPVQVQVRVRAANPDRLRVANTPTVHIAAGTKATVLVDAAAAANGSTPVTVQLLTPQGAAFGRSRSLVIDATDYGLVGWIVIGAAGTVLVAAATLRTVQRVRGRGRA